MKRIVSLLAALCLALVPLMAFAESTDVAATTPAVHRQDYDYSGVDTSKPYTVLMYLVGDKFPGTDDVVAAMNAILEPEYNTTLEVEFLSWSDYQTKYPLVLAGGEKVDLMYTASWCYLYSEAAKGSFFELDDEFIKTNMPMTYANQKAESWGQTTISGNCVGVPCNMMVPNYKYVGIRQDLADKHGIPALSSWDDFMNFCLTIAEKETPESGIFAMNAASDTIELWRTYYEGYNMMGVYNDDFLTIYPEDGTLPEAESILYAVTTEQFRAYAHDMKKLANAGAWSQSALSNTISNCEAFANLTGASCVWNGTIFNYMHQAEANEGITTNAYDLSPSAHVFAEEYNNSVMAVAANSENPERAAMVMDLIGYDYELNLLGLLGLENVNWEDRGNGYYFSDPTQESYPANTNAMGWWMKKDYKISLYADRRMEEFDNNFKTRMVSNPCTTFVFNETPVKAEMAAVSSVKNEYFGQLTLGLTDDVDATIQKMTDQLMASGLQTIYDEFYRQYNEWKANK